MPYRPIHVDLFVNKTVVRQKLTTLFKNMFIYVRVVFILGKDRL